MTADVKTQLLEFARKLGFDSCRVAACSPPAHVAQFGEWLGEGAHGEMSYMARGEEKRRDPQKILHGAKSIIVLALNYFHSEPELRLAGAKETAVRGKIARYAWGDDYHEVIEAK